MWIRLVDVQSSGGCLSDGRRSSEMRAQLQRLFSRQVVSQYFAIALNAFGFFRIAVVGCKLRFLRSVSSCCCSAA